MIKVGHFITSIDINTGGPARSCTHLIKRLAYLNPKLYITLNTFKTDNPIINSFKNNNCHINFHKKYFHLNYFGFKNIAFESDFKLFHAHGIWEYPIHQMSSIAKKLGIPYVISTRGMLEPWPLKQKQILKKLAFHLFQKNDLQKAVCIHATAFSEAVNIRKLGFSNPIAIIPNGINLHEFPDYKKETNSKRKLLFLSRIHVKKGIEILIEAFNDLDDLYYENWEVEIVGDGNYDYIQKLKKIINSYGLSSVIKISDPLYDNDKFLKYKTSDLFVLPSHSENFGIVVAEALASKIPVITTTGTPWQELNKYNCGRWINFGVEPLKDCLKEMLLKSDTELKKMGENGRNLIIESYSIESTAKKTDELYNWILTKKNKPEFIV